MSRVRAPLSAGLAALSFSPPAAAAPLSVADAEAQGLVSASWVGNGASSGDAIRLAVTSAAPAPLLLDVLTGTARARRPPVSPSTRRADAGGAGLA